MEPICWNELSIMEQYRLLIFGWIQHKVSVGVTFVILKNPR